MRVLMCGDRNWQDATPIKVWLAAFENKPVTIIHGAAKGADTLAGLLAHEYRLTVEEYPAKWDEHGRAAGPIRNQQMLTEGKPGVVVAFHDDIAASKGTRDMCERARKAGLPVYVVSRYKP